MTIANDLIVVEEQVAEADAALDRAVEHLQNIVTRSENTTVGYLAEKGLELLAALRCGPNRLLGQPGGVLSADRLRSVLDHYAEERRAEYEEAPTRPSLRVVANDG